MQSMSTPPPPAEPEPGRRVSAPPRGELRAATFAGIRWMTGARVLAETTSFGAMVLLAHLISPSEFGRAAIAMIVPALASILTFEGFGSALVQRDTVEPRHLKTSSLLGLGSGIVLCAVAAVVGPAIANPVFGNETGDYVRLASLSFLLAGITVVPTAQLQRRLDFRSMTIAEVSGVLGGAAISVGLAVAGLEGEAIIIGALCQSAISVSLQARAAPIPALGFDRQAARELLRFGMPASLQGLAWMTTRNIDYAIVGARLGAHALGFYWRAYTLGVEYQNKVSQIMTRIAFPLYSRTEGRDHMSAVHSRVLRVHAVVLFPLLATLIATAPVLIPWLLGARWQPAVEPTQILAVAGMMLALIAGFGQAALAAGKPGALVLNNLFTLALYGPTVYFVAPHGLVPLSVAVVVVVFVTGSAAAYMLLDRAVGIPLKRLYLDAAPATLGAAALLAVAYPLTHGLHAAGVPAVPVLVVAGSAGLAAYLTAVRATSKAAWADLVLLLSHLRPAPLTRRRKVASPT
jgi:lipopolysaccharide exporter